MSVMLSAASCLRWICNLLSVTESQLMDEIAQLTEEELKRAPVFLPYLSGSAHRITIRWRREFFQSAP
jgi:xylulokinase